MCLCSDILLLWQDPSPILWTGTGMHDPGGMTILVSARYTFNPTLIYPTLRSLTVRRSIPVLPGQLPFITAYFDMECGSYNELMSNSDGEVRELVCILN